MMWLIDLIEIISINAVQFDCVMDNVIFNWVAWKLDQSDIRLIVEHSNNLKFMINI